jgi:predicted nucleotidyltransferase
MGNIEDLRQRAQQIADQAAFDAQVNDELTGRLAAINSRDVEQVREYLDAALEALQDRIEDVERTLFGGSVAKSTYVQGLSDVDALVVLSDPPDGTPGDVLSDFAAALAARLSHADVDNVSAGTLAVTVTYHDGTEIQLLPAVQRGDRLNIGSADGDEWKPIHPRRFAKALSELNAEHARAVVPAIKLAKAVIAAQVPEAERPSGYHVEALALAAFSGYSGARTPKAMLTHFFAAAARDVLRPIKDVSGQSHHVDERLGAANSSDRQTLSRDLQRIANLMDNSRRLADWQAVLGDE